MKRIQIKTFTDQNGIENYENEVNDWLDHMQGVNETFKVLQIATIFDDDNKISIYTYLWEA